MRDCEDRFVLKTRNAWWPWVKFALMWLGLLAILILTAFIIVAISSP